MRILMVAFGSRGDVQPIIALGKGLQGAGYEVTLAAGENFGGWIVREGLAFEPFHIDIEAAMQTDLGKEWLGNSSGNPLKELQQMRQMTQTHAAQVADDLLRMAERTDLYLSGFLTVEIMATLAKVFGKRHAVTLLSPVAPTRSGAAGMQAMLPTSDHLLNRWWGYVIEAMLYTVLQPPSKALRARLKMPAASRAEFIQALNRTPTILGVSPLVVPPPLDWGAHIRTTGYWFHTAPDDYAPSPALDAFLNSGDPPVYIGFGSMSNRDPQGTTRLMIEALRKAGRRGILHSGWAGLHAKDLPPDVFLLDYAPHDWLFPRMAAVVHHGGAGTTGAALRAGVPSLVVAHMGDQPYWGRRIHELGAGAAPIRRHALSAARLAESIRVMTRDSALQARAAALGERIRAEDGVGTAVHALGEVL
jgi:UDP:flavonoid glycosyltransferase YjiC (YdhE family)